MFRRPLTLWRPKASDDGAGGQSETFSQVGTDPLKAKVDQPTADDRLVAEQAGASLTHSIYFNGVVDVRRGDELRDLATDERWHVFSVVRPSTPVYTKALSTIEQHEES